MFFEKRRPRGRQDGEYPGGDFFALVVNSHAGADQERALRRALRPPNYVDFFIDRTRDRRKCEAHANRRKGEDRETPEDIHRDR